jgi:hypothetical protein
MREHPLLFCDAETPQEMGSEKGNVKIGRKVGGPQIIVPDA